MEKDWVSLALEGSVQDRREVDDIEIDVSIEMELRNIRSSLVRIRQALLLDGMKITDDFYETARETRFTDEETMLSPRVRYNEERQTVSFYWERTERHIRSAKGNEKGNQRYGRGYSYLAYSRSSRNGQKRRVKVFLGSKHVPINKTTKRISASAFAGEPEWARIAGEIIEDHLCHLRKENDAVATVSRALARLEKMAKERRKV